MDLDTSITNRIRTLLLEAKTGLGLQNQLALTQKVSYGYVENDQQSFFFIQVYHAYEDGKITIIQTTLLDTQTPIDQIISLQPLKRTEGDGTPGLRIYDKRKREY